MRDYWTCSKFADWLRGTMKPHAETSKGWATWKKEAKAKHPVRYWIAEEGLDLVQDVWMWIPDRLNDIRYYINNRWVSQTHGMYAHSLEKGKWHEYETRLLHSMFDQLVDFVEIEQAWHHVMWDEEARKRFETPWWRKGWLRWRTWRCPDAGIEYLIWASGLKIDEGMGCEKNSEHYGQPTQQAINAQEVLELYRWWKVERPKRLDPHDAGGWTEYCEQRRKNGHDFFDFEDKSPEDAERSKVALNKTHEIETAYNNEDEAMMIRLIKIRAGLWT